MGLKPIPKRIVCITQLDDDSVVCSYFGCEARHQIKWLLDLCDRDVKRKLQHGTPLCPKESASGVVVPTTTLEEG